MRLAILADIHGNLLALEAVMADLRATAPDLVVNLGDHLSGPLWAAGTADLLMSQSEWIHIRGNHDRQLLDRPFEQMGLSDQAAFSELTGEHQLWLAALPATQRLDAGIFLCHGTAASDVEYFLEDVGADGSVTPAAPSTAAERLHGVTDPLVLCGHTHVPRQVLTPRSLIVNPGSVGLPAYDDTQPYPHCMEAGTPHARYAVADQAGGRWQVEVRALVYDWDQASRRAASGRRPDWARALATGRTRD